MLLYFKFKGTIEHYATHCMHVPSALELVIDLGHTHTHTKKEKKRVFYDPKM